MQIYKPIESVSPIYSFGGDRRDWDGLSPEEWFHENHERFLLDLSEVRAAKQPFHAAIAPDKEGIYFLFMDDALIYVGLSKQIGGRIWRHTYPDGGFAPAPWFNAYSAIWVPELYLAAVESFYINHFNPPRNAKRLPPHLVVDPYLQRVT